MILFQIAKWMEERGRLLISIRERKGDVPQLIAEKRLIERQLFRGAQLWCEGKVMFELPEAGDALPTEASLLQYDELWGEKEDRLLRHLPAYMIKEDQVDRAETEYSPT